MYCGIKHENIVVIGSGSSLSRYGADVLSFVNKMKCKTIGINNMVSLCCPDYHLWTNKQRYIDFGHCINSKVSKLMFGHKMTEFIIRKYYAGKYIKVVYSDEDKFLHHMSINEQHIKGRFRTAGVLAVAIAYLMEAKNIWVAGMDGYTYHPESRLLRGKKSQHCYGKGKTDDASWKDSVKKDNLVYQSLDELAKIVNFKIITPTKFVKHFDASVIGIKE